MLERFRTAQEASVARLMALEAAGRLPPPCQVSRPPFAASLRGKGPGAVIAEYKRASPSRGSINLLREPEEMAGIYAAGGAAAISVLTEEAYFHGNIAFLQRMHAVGLPLLRKDFLLHPLQVAETAATPASALLLIVRFLEPELLRQMLDETEKAGLEAVVEIFDAADLEAARKALAATAARPALIQVNTRDLNTLQVNDRLLRELIREKDEQELWIAASGAGSAHDVRERTALGYDAVLVGTSLMAAENPEQALAALVGASLSAPVKEIPCRPI